MLHGQKADACHLVKLKRKVCIRLKIRVCDFCKKRFSPDAGACRFPMGHKRVRDCITERCGMRIVLHVAILARMDPECKRNPGPEFTLSRCLRPEAAQQYIRGIRV